MNLQECYTELGGDFKDVSVRLFSEALVRKFVLKFLDDQSFLDLCSAMRTADYEKAFIAAHTLKGVCQNLSFTRLYQSSSLLTDELRGGSPDAVRVNTLFANVSEDYRVTVDAIRRFCNETGGV